MNELILLSRTTEVTSFYTLEPENPSTLCRVGPQPLDAERLPVPFKVKLPLALRVLGGSQQCNLCPWDRTMTDA